MALCHTLTQSHFEELAMIYAQDTKGLSIPENICEQHTQTHIRTIRDTHPDRQETEYKNMQHNEQHRKIIHRQGTGNKENELIR